MNNTKFDGATLIGANLSSASFSGANFDNAILVGAIFAQAVLAPTADGTSSAATMTGTDIRGTKFVNPVNLNDPANMDGVDMKGAVYSTDSGSFDITLPNYDGTTSSFTVEYGATVLGTTTKKTTCPNGSLGPCTLS